MNYSKTVFLINDAARAVVCSYDDRSCNDKTFKTLDPDIQEDDYVVVPTSTRHGFTCVKVVETDVNLDLDSSEQIDWIVGKVDIDAHEKRVYDEKKAINTVKSAEQRRKREELRESLKLDAQAMQALSLAAPTEEKPTLPDAGDIE